MKNFQRIPSLLLSTIFALAPLSLVSQTPAAETLPFANAAPSPLPLPEDRGAAGLEQALRRLRSTASVLFIVAHPDDEDGALLTYLSRVKGARVSMLTLTRGEGGQNAMGGESYDALGLIRTNELLRADEYYGVRQYWGSEADFGFSKTQEEAFSRWSHERVLYDAVLAVRRARPQIILSTFVGGITDGHGHHQVAGEIAQEALRAAADPKIFPDQIKAGFLPWQAQAVYSMTPFARIENGRMFDYATGKWSPAGFKNYLSGTWTDGALSADVTIAVGDRDPVLGRSPLQIAREGWGEQRSQYGGANPALSGPASSRYHLWFAVPEAQAAAGSNAANNDLFVNSKVRIDTSIAGLTQLAGAQQPQWLKQALRKIDADLQSFFLVRPTLDSTTQAHRLAAIYKQWIELRARVVAEPLSAENKNNLLFELDAKSGQFQSALAQLLGLELSAFRASSGSGSTGGIAGRGASADETQRSVAPGEELRVRVHTAQDGDSAKLNFVWLKSRSGSDWKIDPPSVASETGDSYFTLYVSEDAQPTEPYFTRPSIEQPWYDIADSSLRGESFAPWSLEAWAEFTFDDQPIRLGQVVQTLARVPGRGGVYEPLIVTPAVGLSMEPESVLLPEEDGRALEVSVHVHAQKAASGTIRLHLPEGWRSEPAESPFALKTSGESEPIRFRIYPASSWRAVRDGSYTISAEAAVAGRSYATGWRSIGYPGLRPYNHYRAAQLHALKADVKIAPGLSVACVMGTGDEVPAAIESLGVKPHLLTDTELRTADLKQWKVIVVGIRAYTVRPALSAVEGRLEEFVRGGGNLIVQYQDRDFPAPAALKLGSSPEKVVEESAPVKLLEAQNSLLSWPNKITTQDFDGWVEERGHSFLASWGSEFTALTETADQGQDPQRGGLVVGHFGKGSYVYVAYALHRQLPQLVPGSYRLLANLLSAAEKEQ